jgi:ubiquinone/menaquinone biosynthesis C-methylase UbiE
MNRPPAEDLGVATDMEAVDRLLAVRGLALADVGCGGGRTSRGLAKRGATVTGVEPDPIQAEKNRAAPACPGLRFTEGHAQNLPLEDATTDGVFFFYSLHHVPADELATALGDAVRVLKPGSGFLYVAEPAIRGAYYELYRPFHDETEVRTLARAALDGIRPRFARHHHYRYGSVARYADFETFVTDVSGTSYNRITREMVDRPDVRALFEAGRTDDGYAFEEIVTLDLYRDVGAA